MQLAGDYPLNAQMTFSNLTYAGLRPLIGGDQQPFDASANGQITVNGPITKTDALRATVQIAKLEAHSITPAAGLLRKPRVTFELHNEGPIVAALDRSVVTIQSAHIVGPFTDLSLTGTASIADPKTLNLRANGNVKLEILEAFSREYLLRRRHHPQRRRHRDHRQARRQRPPATAERLVQHARHPQRPLQRQRDRHLQRHGSDHSEHHRRDRWRQGHSRRIRRLRRPRDAVPRHRQGRPHPRHRARQRHHQASAQIVAAGTTARSLVSGNVSIEDVALHSHSDIGSMLAQAATPPPAATASTGLLGGMRFDIKIQTAPDVQFRTTLTQNLQLDANVTLRGTPDHPGMLGRVVVTQGEVVFFGSKYTIDQGTVTFFDPNKINPVLNIDLETTVQGIDVAIERRPAPWIA